MLQQPGRFLGLACLVILGCLPACDVPSATEDPDLPGTDQTEVPAPASNPLPAGAVVRLGSRRLRHPGGVGAVAFSPDGRWLATGGARFDWSIGDGAICLWDAATGRELRRLETWSAFCMAFSPDCQTIAVGWDCSMTMCGWDPDTISLYDVATGKQTRTLWPQRQGSIWSLAFSSNGTLLAAADRQGVVAVWETATGREVQRCSLPDDPACLVAFAPDGKTLVLGSSMNFHFQGNHWVQGPGTIHVWDLATHRERLCFVVDPKSYIESLSLSPDGQTVGVVANRKANLWDLATGRKVRDLKPEEDARCLTFSPDGLTVALGCYRTPTLENDNGAVFLVEAATGRDRRPALPGLADSLAFSPDGKTLATAGLDAAVRLWNTATGRPLLPPDGPTNAITCLAFSPDGRQVVAGAEGGKVFVYDAAHGTERLHRQLRAGFGPYAGLGSVAITRAGKVLVSTNGSFLKPNETRTAILWEAISGRSLLELPAAEPRSRGTTGSVALSPDGRTAATAGDARGVILWDTATGQEQARLGPQLEDVFPRVFSADGGTLAVGWERPTKAQPYGPIFDSLWDVTARKLIRTITEGERGGPVALSSDGRLFATWDGEKDVVQVWNVATGTEWRRLAQPGELVRSLAFSLDSATLAVGEESGAVSLWELETAQEILRRKGHDAVVTALAFSPDGRELASGSADTTILVWDLARGAGGGPSRR